MTIVISNLTHVYEARRGTGRKPALHEISMIIEAGQVRGLLGPNGAGKTTLMKILSGLLIPSSGSVTVFGKDLIKDLNEIKPMIGIVFGGDKGLYPQLSAQETLEYWAALYNLPRQVKKERVHILLSRFGLLDLADTRVETFSRGMKQRLHLARGLISDAQILLFDEPTMGMDPVAARDFRKLIQELRDEGRIIILTTHDMAEAEAVCDSVMLIDKGEILATESPATLSRMVSDFSHIQIRTSNNDLIKQATELPEVIKYEIGIGVTKLFFSGKHKFGDAINSLFAIGVMDFEIKEPTLEDVYIKAIGNRGFSV